MKNTLEKDKKKRSLYFDFEKKRKFLKVLIKNESINASFCDKAKHTFFSMPRDSSLVRIRNRCILTGRGRAVLTSFRLSRLMLRKFGRSGLIRGFIKSS